MIRALISGRLVRSAELKTSSNGKSYATGTVALDGTDPEGGGLRFVRCTAFGQNAEMLAALPKGAAVSAAGRLEVGVWKRDDGTTEATGKLLVDELAVLRAKSPRAEVAA